MPRRPELDGEGEGIGGGAADQEFHERPLRGRIREQPVTSQGRERGGQGRVATFGARDGRLGDRRGAVEADLPSEIDKAS